MANQPDQTLAHRKTRDRALILPLAGVLLLLPPFAAVFDFKGRLFGLPVTWVYVFAVWAVLIAAAAHLARRLAATEGAQGPREDAEQRGDEAP